MVRSASQGEEGRVLKLQGSSTRGLQSYVRSVLLSKVRSKESMTDFVGIRETHATLTTCTWCKSIVPRGILMKVKQG